MATERAGSVGETVKETNPDHKETNFNQDHKETNFQKESNFPTPTPAPIQKGKVVTPKDKVVVEPEKFLIVDKVNEDLFTNEYDSRYPFNDLDIGQAIFVPNAKAETTDKTLERMHQVVRKARAFYAEVELDDNGDEVWEQVVIKSRKRNADGSFVLDAVGKPLESADSVLRPKLIGSRHYIVRPVVKDYDTGGQKAPEDGVLIIRVI